jgi:hypothetical protein
MASFNPDSIRVVTTLFDEVDQNLEPVREFVLAVLKSVDGSVEVPNRPNYVWAADWNQEQSIYQILNKRVAPIEGLHVKIGYPEKPPFNRQVLGTWDDVVELSTYDEGAGDASNTRGHGFTHQYPSEGNPGIDPVMIYQPALMMLKTTSREDDMTVRVFPLTYTLRGVPRQFYGISLDLTSYLPAAGLAKYVLIYIDGTTNTVYISEGDSVTDSTAVTAPKPLLPANCIASSYIRLTASMTEVLMTDIEDAREFLHINAGEVNIPVPDETGQIMVSEANQQWTNASPLFDNSGSMICDDNGKMVTTT